MCIRDRHDPGQVQEQQAQGQGEPAAVRGHEGVQAAEGQQEGGAADADGCDGLRRMREDDAGVGQDRR
eukprot:4425545-Pyramimonas_sp.AAC.1